MNKKESSLPADPQLVINQLPFAAIVTNESGGIIAFNDASKSIFPSKLSSKSHITDLLIFETDQISNAIADLQLPEKKTIHVSAQNILDQTTIDLRVGKLSGPDNQNTRYLWMIEVAKQFDEKSIEKGCGIFHQVFDPLLACSNDELLTITDANQPARELFGEVADELVGSSLLMLLRKSNGEAITKTELDQGILFNCLISNQNKLLNEIRLKRLSHHSFGHHTIVFAAQEFGSEHKLKVALQKGKQYFELLLQSIPFGIVVLDDHDRILDCNQMFEQLFGYRKYKLLGQFINDMIVPKDLKDDGLGLTEAVSSGKNIYVETKRLTADNQIIDVAITGRPIVLPNGERRVFGIYQDIRERIRLQHAIEDEKNFFQSLFENVPFGIVIINEQEKVIDCNHKFSEMFGYSKSQIIELQDIQVIFPEGFKEEGKQLRSQVLKGEFVYKETLRKNRQGQNIEVAISAVLISRMDGSKYIFGIYQDISDRKLAEKKLKASEQQLADIVQYLPGMVYRCYADENYTMLFASEGSMRVTGYLPSSFTGKAVHFNDIILEKYRDEIWNMWQNVIQTNDLFDFEYQIYDANGGLRWVWERGRAVKDSHGRVQYLEGYIENITDRKGMQDSLTKERDLLQALMDNIPDTIYFKNRDSKFIRINKSQAKTLGIENPEEAIHKSDFDFFDNIHAEKAYEDEQMMMETGIPVINKMERIQTAQGWRWFAATKVPLANKSGVIQGMAGISRDVTEIKALEVKLRDSEKNLSRINQEKDKLFSVIAHDLRSPFNSFLLLTEMLADELFNFDKDELISLTKSMYKTATGVSELLENLLEWSRIQRGLISCQLQAVDVAEIIQKNLDYFQTHLNSKQIQLSLFADQKIQVCADKSMLSSIIRNLVSNAIKFTPHHGTIKIFVSMPDPETVLIRIQDSGVGMNEELQKKLFSVETRGRKGTDDEPSSGLGLILVKEFVEKLNGKIYLETKVNVGTTFFVSLPARCK